jgi:hypothetical protein
MQNSVPMQGSSTFFAEQAENSGRTNPGVSAQGRMFQLRL